ICCCTATVSCTSRVCACRARKSCITPSCCVPWPIWRGRSAIRATGAPFANYGTGSTRPTSRCGRPRSVSMEAQPVEQALGFDAQAAAAVHTQYLAGDVVGVLAEQEAHHGGNVLGPTDALERDILHDTLLCRQIGCAS